MDSAALPGKIAQMLTGYWVAQMIHVAAKLDLAGRLAAGPRAAHDLAKETGTRPRELYRLLRGLSSLGVFAEVDPRRFQNTPLSATLIDGVPGSQRAMAMMIGEEPYAAWGELLHCLKTGKTGIEQVYKKPLFEYLADHPEQAATFDAAMTSVHGRETPAMLAAYDFSGIGVLADIGGGNGSLISATLQKHLGLRGLLYDLPHVIERTQKNIAAAGLAERCQCVAGSFFESVPAGPDAYLMRHILHDWDDAESIAILKNVRRAIGAGSQARLLVVETVILPGNEPMFGKLIDLNMMVVPGGLERTEVEYRELFAAADFRLNRIVPTATEVSVVEAVPV